MATIPLTKGFVAIIDDEDYVKCMKYSWHARVMRHTVYAITNSPIRALPLSKVVLGVYNRNVEIDHKNRNGLDNTKDNLRIVTRQQNLWNTKGKRRWGNSTSQYKGVYWDRQIKRWRAQIMCNYHRISIGCFGNETEAALAYNTKAKELFGEFAYLNPVEEG